MFDISKMIDQYITDEQCARIKRPAFVGGTYLNARAFVKEVIMRCLQDPSVVSHVHPDIKQALDLYNLIEKLRAAQAMNNEMVDRVIMSLEYLIRTYDIGGQIATLEGTVFDTNPETKIIDPMPLVRNYVICIAKNDTLLLKNRFKCNESILDETIKRHIDEYIANEELDRSGEYKVQVSVLISYQDDGDHIFKPYQGYILTLYIEDIDGGCHDTTYSLKPIEPSNDCTVNVTGVQGSLFDETESEGLRNDND